MEEKESLKVLRDARNTARYFRLAVHDPSLSAVTVVLTMSNAAHGPQPTVKHHFERA